jgi:DNA polymerase III alpha subunit
VATEIAGLSWEQADHLRRGMSKFQAAEMERMRVAFIAGCRETRHRDGAGDRGLSLQQAETLWEQVLAFAGYGFNQGHATAYADISYRSAYLKSHWPAAFLCARLADWGGFHHPAVYMAEAIRLGIAVRPPHVNQSGRKFTLTRKVSSGEWTVNSRQWAVNSDQEAVNGRGTLWMGLGQVRDLRRASVRAVVAQRQIGPFAGVRDLLGRVPLQAKEATHLIQCGALDGLGSSRAALLAEFAEVRRAGSVQQLAFDLGTVRVEPESPAQRLAWERHILGQPVSVHPLALVQDRLPALPALGELGATAGRPVQVAGARLPGWTGSQGFYLSDGTTYVTAKTDRQMANPHAWEPILVRGRWRQDEWGSAWLQVESWSVIE